MLKILLKKQLAEVFRAYFYNAKKNKMRSKWAVAGWIVFFIVIMVGVMGGMFTALSLTLCATMVEQGVGWLYFLLLGGLAILLGAFGSVFNSYVGLYLSKDNDLLLSMPIPVRDIIAARLLNVWLLGAMYAAVAILPAIVVYWITAGVTAARIACGVLLFIVITAVVLMLSILLGWVVAKISLKLKHKSFATVAISIAFIGAYYFFYFKASDLIRDLLLNAARYGARIKGAARGLYWFGRIGEGDWTAAAGFLAGAAALLALAWFVLSRSFIAIATSSGKSEHVRYREKRARRKTPFMALLGKELARFTASPNYMLNCGLGILFAVAFGAFLLIKGSLLLTPLSKVFAGLPGCVEVLLCAAICLVTGMNDTAAPSVSLEGKNLWIAQSLPVEPRWALRAKALMQLLLSGLPALLAAVCAAAVVEAPLTTKLLLCVVPVLYAAFYALVSTLLGVKLPILTWTNETAPIKQSASVLIAILIGWLTATALGGLYLWVGHKLGAAAYLALCAAVFAGASLILLRWIDTRGARAFAAL